MGNDVYSQGPKGQVQGQQVFTEIPYITHTTVRKRRVGTQEKFVLEQSYGVRQLRADPQGACRLERSTLFTPWDGEDDPPTHISKRLP